MKIPDAKAAVDKAWVKLAKVASMANGEKVKNKKKRPLKSCYVDGHLSSQKMRS